MVPRGQRVPARSGVLVLDKAAGLTSFDVVAIARRVLGIRRIGHAGTLDPDAVGVLPLLVGEATKLMPYLVDQDKAYLAAVRLGVTTDTHDLAGRVIATAAVPPLSLEDLERALRPFVGRIRQVPPMYSAVHHGGRRLHELAREGRDVPREPREVLVRSITVEHLLAEVVTLRVVCGKGTYIRVLAADLGVALGCGAAVERLVRLRVGPFGLDGALPSAELRVAARDAVLARLLPPDAALAGWAVVHLDHRRAALFLHGQAVGAPTPVEDGGLVRVRDERGSFLGVARVIEGASRIRPERIFHADRSGTRVLPA
jgi:tRNA pseudouridine55 synthase